MCFQTRTACTAARSGRSGSYSASGTLGPMCKACRARPAKCEPHKGCRFSALRETWSMHTHLGSDVTPLALRKLAADFIELGALTAWAAEPFDMEMVEQGRRIFETIAGVGCKACHGTFAEGKVGPSNRGVNEATIREALAKIGPMQFLREQLAEEDIKRVAAYTEWMGRHMLVKSLLKRGRFIPDAISVY